MEKSKSVLNEDVCRCRDSEGRRQGERRWYIPWMLVEDFASMNILNKIFNFDIYGR